VKEYILNLKLEDSTGDHKWDSSKLAKEVMGKRLAHKMLSNQENMVHLAGLDLQHCSETIETVSISGSYHLIEDGHVYRLNSLLKWYASRKEKIEMSFDY
jgi:hypothetical protein